MNQIQLHLDKSYQIPIKTSKKRRSISLKITRSGEIELHTPEGVPHDYLEKFVHSRSQWLKKHLNQVNSNPITPLDEVFADLQAKLWVHGRELPLKVCIQSGQSPQFRLHQENIELLYHGKSTPSTLIRNFKKWMHSLAQEDFQGRLDHWSNKMDIPYDTLEIRSFKSRWGDCHQSGLIRMNWKSIATPESVRDSLCIHELAHRIHMNHSKEFYHLVRGYDPQERASHTWLKEHAQILDY